MKSQMTGVWQANNEPVHKALYGASVGDLLAALRELIEGVCREDRNGFTFGAEGEFPIETLRKDVVDWPVWYHDELDKRIRLSPRYAVIVGYNLNDVLSSSAFGTNQLHRLFDMTKPEGAGKVCKAFAFHGTSRRPTRVAVHGVRGEVRYCRGQRLDSYEMLEDTEGTGEDEDMGVDPTDITVKSEIPEVAVLKPSIGKAKVFAPPMPKAGAAAKASSSGAGAATKAAASPIPTPEDIARVTSGLAKLSRPENADHCRTRQDR